MATSARYPVVLWRDHAGMYTARLLDEDNDGIAVSNNRRECLRQLGDYLLHLHQDDGYWFQPTFLEPQLRTVKVTVYPEYKEGERTFACKDALMLRLPCVTGERHGGMFTALLPTLDLPFDYHDAKALTRLCTHYVRSYLRGRTPQELSRYLPPVSVELDRVVVTLKERRVSMHKDRDYPELQAIADSLLSRDRQRLTRTWEREEEVREVARLLADTKDSVILTGPSGCGKSAVIREAARAMTTLLPQVQDRKHGSEPRCWLTNAGRIISGMRFLGQWEERLEQAIEELSGLRGILCIENLLDLVQLGGDGPDTSIAAFLSPFIQNGDLRILTEATAEELEACDRLLPGLVDPLRIIRLPAFDEASAVRVIEKAAAHLAQNESVSVERTFASDLFHLFDRFLPYAAFPGKALDFLLQLVDTVSDNAGSKAIAPHDLHQAFSSFTGLPQTFFRPEHQTERDKIRTFLNARVLAQEAAIETLVTCLTTFQAGLNDPRRPLGVYLMCGPTGVGKTALAKAVSDYLLSGDPGTERLIRLDMSEYAAYDAAERLLGNPRGQPSELIRKIRRQPFSVILLDEIEKASAEVFDIFLSIFEEGRLTDALGRLTSFHSCLILMTSNLGAEGARRIGYGSESGGVDREAIRKFFRPEFFNRLDDMIYFHALDESAIRAITRKELEDLTSREGLAAGKHALVFDDALVEWLSREGFDAKFGARPLQRKIEETVVAPLSLHLLENCLDVGSALHLSLDDTEKLAIRRS